MLDDLAVPTERVEPAGRLGLAGRRVGGRDLDRSEAEGQPECLKLLPEGELEAVELLTLGHDSEEVAFQVKVS